MHGGGATPVGQTPDTDLNQGVRKDYTVLESQELMEQMRLGVCVPSPKQETCIDMMHETLVSKERHIKAAKGYKYTGATVSLSGNEDHMICREAGKFFRDLRMREKINAAVADVQAEVRAGRLKWTEADVLRLITPYPTHKVADDVLEKLGEHAWLDRTPECGVEDDELEEDEACVDDLEKALSEEATPDDEEKIAASGAIALEDAPEGESRSCGGAFPCAGEIITTTAIELSESDADHLHTSRNLVEAYDQAIEALRPFGAYEAIQNIQHLKTKELRRQRHFADVDPAVAEALARTRQQNAAEQARKQRELEDMNAEARKCAERKKELRDTSVNLKKRKAELIEAEGLLEAQHALKTFSLVQLGKGHAKGGGATGRKRRFEVLDRMARNGSGLSPAQKNDWAWFKDAWDDKMLAEHKMEWATTFAAWMQKVLNDMDGNISNAFSLLVNSETRRCFGDSPALQVPGS